ncbi:hypothetical protein [Moraxella caviae]|uniref:hypothetical protein n=1 Tax=Moraxella caviae TaxID=34060 RepID=UPI0015592004|nr:hypothetical protein [Moraxella caviae]
MGTFTKYDDLDKFDHTCPEKLFDWVYGTVHAGVSVIEKPSCWQRFKAWLLRG